VRGSGPGRDKYFTLQSNGAQSRPVRLDGASLEHEARIQQQQEAWLRSRRLQ
jgi:hypothetical protein